jgi:hypothetical protein
MKNLRFTYPSALPLLPPQTQSSVRPRKSHLASRKIDPFCPCMPALSSLPLDALHLSTVLQPGARLL